MILNKEVINKNSTYFFCTKKKLEHIDHNSFNVANNSLIRLMLEQNNFTKLNINLFVNLKKLEFINLSNNKLKIIYKSLFKYNTNLKVIYLANNKIIYFNLILDNFPKLFHVGLKHNHLPTLKSEHFREYVNNESTIYTNKNRYINIDHNQFNCNNSMDWIRKVNKLITIRIDFLGKPSYCRNLIDNHNITLGCFLGIKFTKVPKLINC